LILKLAIFMRCSGGGKLRDSRWPRKQHGCAGNMAVQATWLCKQHGYASNMAKHTK